MMYLLMLTMLYSSPSLNGKIKQPESCKAAKIAIKKHIRQKKKAKIFFYHNKSMGFMSGLSES